mgnify:FL=1
MVSPASIWMTQYIIASTVLLWMESVSKTQMTSSTPKSKTISQILFLKLDPQLSSEWLVMVWILSQRVWVSQLMQKSATGFALMGWELILMDAKVISMVCQQLRQSISGLPRFLNKSIKNRRFQLSLEMILDYNFPLIIISINTIDCLL